MDKLSQQTEDQAAFRRLTIITGSLSVRLSIRTTAPICWWMGRPPIRLCSKPSTARKSTFISRPISLLMMKSVRNLLQD